MSRNSRRLALTVTDLLCLLAALSLAGIWHSNAAVPVPRHLFEITAAWAGLSAAWILVARRIGTYAVPPRRNLVLALRRTVEAWVATWGLGGLVTLSLLPTAAFDIWLLFLAGLSLLAFTRVALSYSPAGDASDRLRAIVIGACPSARALSSSRDATDAVELVGFVPFTNEHAGEMPHLPCLGSIGDLRDILREHQVDVAFVSPSDDAITGEVHKAIDTCEGLGLQTQYFPAFLDVDDLHVGMVWSANRPGLNLRPTGEPSLAAFGKRAIDVLGASIGLILLLPAFVACALAVKLTSRGPILFRQTRVGRGGRTFNCLKFRTMRVGAHTQQELLRAASLQDGPAFKVADDPRVTPVGRILRKFSLDELPQLLNVLFGDMSLVGPRPPIPSEVDKYTWWQRRRIAVKPGLTCIWQVYGRNKVSFKRWVEMDLYYIDNWSLWLDLKLIAHTFGVVLRGTGM